MGRRKALKLVSLQDVLRHKAAFAKSQGATRDTVICLEHDSTVAHALKVLAKHHILSAPLVIPPSLEDMETEAGGAGLGTSQPSLAGWVDVSDLLNGLITQMHKLHPDGKLPTNLLLLMSELDKESKTYVHRTMMEISVGRDKALMYESEKDTSLLDAIQGCYLNNGGIPGRVVHRAALFNMQGEISHIISMLDIIRMLSSRAQELLADAAGKTVGELGLVCEGTQRQLVCLDPHLPTLLALERMKETGVSGAAVTSPQTGVLAANLSMSDLRLITPEHFSVLALPVAEFLALSHNTSYLGFSQKAAGPHHPFFALGRRSVGPEDENDRIPLFTCTPSSPLSEVLETMAKNSVHRVYIVDQDSKPLGVLTPTDLLRWIVS